MKLGIEKTQNNLTSLLRTPKIQLEKLNLRAVYMSYENISMGKATNLAKETPGYAYAYQLLGSILYESGSKELSKEVLDKYDIRLEEDVYMKIWESLTGKEKKLIYAMLKTNNIHEIMELAEMNNSSLQVYKKRLHQQGIVDISERGKINFLLPRFKEFAEFQKEMES